MQTEIIPLCLRIMKRGLELSRTVATFIVQKILNDEKGLNYISQTADRFYAVFYIYVFFAFINFFLKRFQLF